MNNDLEVLSSRWLAACLNGGYQGVFITVGIWLVLRFLPRTNASTRHAMWISALVVVALLPIAHFTARRAAPSPIEEELLMATPSPRDFPQSAASQGVATELTPPSTAAISTWPSTPMETPTSFASPVPAQDRDVPPSWPPRATTVAYLAPSEPEGSGASTRPAVAPLSPAEWSLVLPPNMAALVVALWLLTTMARLWGLVSECIALHRLKHSATLPNERSCRIFDKLKLELRLRRSARLRISPKVETPMAAGFLKPMVLLPAWIEGTCSDQGLEQVLRHELAHLERLDDWSNLIQRLVHAVFWMHPAIRCISSRLSIEREIACDDHVLSAIRAPKAYALFLTEFAGQMKNQNWTIAPAAWTSKNQLKERICMILDSNRDYSPRLTGVIVGLLTTAAVLLAVLGLHAGPRFAFAAANTADVAEAAAAAEAKPEQSSNDTAPELPPAEAASPKTVTGRPGAKSGTTISAPAADPAAGAVLPATVEPVKPSPKRRVLLPTPSAEPLPPRKPRNSEDDSLERRLERLERMVESLADREKQKAYASGFESRGKDSETLPREDARNSPVKPRKRKFSELDLEDLNGSKENADVIKEKVEKETNRARREVEKSFKEEVDISINGAYAGRPANPPGGILWKEGRQPLEAERKALEAQRRALEKQIQSLQKLQQWLEEKEKQLAEEKISEEKK